MFMSKCAVNGSIKVLITIGVTVKNNIEAMNVSSGLADNVTVSRS